MGLGLQLQRWIGQWRQMRAGRPEARPTPDPADCGTAWGLDLTLLPPPKKHAAKHAAAVRPSRH